MSSYMVYHTDEGSGESEYANSTQIHKVFLPAFPDSDTHLYSFHTEGFLNKVNKEYVQRYPSSS